MKSNTTKAIWDRWLWILDNSKWLVQKNTASSNGYQTIYDHNQHHFFFLSSKTTRYSFYAYSTQILIPTMQANHYKFYNNFKSEGTYSDYS